MAACWSHGRKRNRIRTCAGRPFEGGEDSEVRNEKSTAVYVTPSAGHSPVAADRSPAAASRSPAAASHPPAAASLPPVAANLRERGTGRPLVGTGLRQRGWIAPEVAVRVRERGEGLRETRAGLHEGGGDLRDQGAGLREMAVALLPMAPSRPRIGRTLGKGRPRCSSPPGHKCRG